MIFYQHLSHVQKYSALLLVYVEFEADGERDKEQNDNSRECFHLSYNNKNFFFGGSILEIF
jgi:hypothetical protein